jgi:hypothetical protein
MTTFSVLICTYNRHLLLAKALQTLIEGLLEKPDQIEVVNSGEGRPKYGLVLRGRCRFQLAAKAVGL